MRMAKMFALVDHFSITFGPDMWLQPSLKLAETFVAGFELEGSEEKPNRGRGRPHKSGATDQWALFQQIHFLRQAAQKRGIAVTVVEACNVLASKKLLDGKDNPFKGKMKSSLEVAYHRARKQMEIWKCQAVKQRPADPK